MGLFDKLQTPAQLKVEKYLPVLIQQKASGTHVRIVRLEKINFS